MELPFSVLVSAIAGVLTCCVLWALGVLFGFGFLSLAQNEAIVTLVTIFGSIGIFGLFMCNP